MIAVPEGWSMRRLSASGACLFVVSALCRSVNWMRLVYQKKHKYYNPARDSGRRLKWSDVAGCEPADEAVQVPTDIAQVPYVGHEPLELLVRAAFV